MEADTVAAHIFTFYTFKTPSVFLHVVKIRLFIVVCDHLLFNTFLLYTADKNAIIMPVVFQFLNLTGYATFKKLLDLNIICNLH